VRRDDCDEEASLADRTLYFFGKGVRRFNLVAVQPKAGLRNAGICLLESKLLPKECDPSLDCIVERWSFVISAGIADEHCSVSLNSVGI
jgi:hypothetical protein